MEFFVKAHVSKKQPPKKDSKSEEMVKKQLKKMLQGYKKSDNELIKDSGNCSNDIVEAHRCIEDSASVSGFSDLELSTSEAEEEISQATTSQTVNSISLSSSDVNISNLSELNSDQEVISNIDELIMENSDDQESISEYKRDESLLKEIEFSEDSETSRDVSLTDLEETSTELGSNDTGSDAFDPDGALASKIHEKLGKMHNMPEQKGKKRKLEDRPKKSKSKKNDMKNKASNKKQKDDENIIEMESLKIKNVDEVIIDSKSESNNSQDSVSTKESSPFISLTVTHMPEQRLSDILGDYKHPTVRHLQNIVQTTNCLLSFGTDSTEMVVEDVDSLVPEFGDDVIEELDTDLETSTDMPNEESTTVYDDTILSDTERELSSEDITPVQSYYGKNCYIFVLKHPEGLYVNGKLKVKCLGGTVEVFGHIIKDAVNLYAPNNNFAQCIKTVETPNDYYGLFRKLTSEGLLVREAEEIVSQIGPYDGVISLAALDDVKIDFVENNVYMDLFKKPSKKIERSLKQISTDFGCGLSFIKPWRYFEENESWEEAVTCGFENNSRGIVCGGKGLGKSTFLRYYVNRMLASGPVLVIDLDPGQAEFTVAGNVSATVVTVPLLGPNYTHLKTPDITLNIGLISTMDNVTRYANAVTEILAHCRSNPAYSSMPWIINTMGMCTQMGLKFLLLTILHAQPTFILQIDSKVTKKRFECHLQPYAVRQLYENFGNDRLFRNVDIPNLDYTLILTKHAEGSDKHDTSQSPKDGRYLNYLAYFGELLNIHRGANFLGITPYEVSLSDVNVLTNVKVASDAVLKVINGKVVALCQLAIGDKGKVFTLQDNALLCHGHGNYYVVLKTKFSCHRSNFSNKIIQKSHKNQINLLRNKKLEQDTILIYLHCFHIEYH